jgi:hypothetical protein
MAISNMFKTLKQFKSTGKVQLQPPTPKENVIKCCSSVLPVEEK